MMVVGALDMFLIGILYFNDTFDYKKVTENERAFNWLGLVQWVRVTHCNLQ